MTTYEQTGEKAKPSFELSPDTRRLADRFLKMEPGEQVTYAQLNALVPGSNVQIGSGRSILDSARRLAIEEGGIVIACVHGIGMQRVKNDDIPGIGDHHIGKIRRTCKAGAEKLRCCEFSALTSDRQSKLNANLAVLGAIQMFTKQKALKAVQKASEQSQATLVTDAVIKLFS